MLLAVSGHLRSMVNAAQARNRVAFDKQQAALKTTLQREDSLIGRLNAKRSRSSRRNHASLGPEVPQ
jgi:hypothetical protein